MESEGSSSTTERGSLVDGGSGDDAEVLEEEAFIDTVGRDVRAFDLTEGRDCPCPTIALPH